MAFIMRNESFSCLHCGKKVSPHPAGSARNHCPYCLYSLHVDADSPGDRASDCGGLMAPIAREYRKNKGDMILHRCQTCGKEIPNKIAPDDDFLGWVRDFNSKHPL